jgi:hypothetical protein
MVTPLSYTQKKRRVNTIEWIGKARMASTQGWLKPLRLRITQTSLPLAGSYLLEVLTIKARGNGVKVKYYTTALTRILTAGIQWYEELILQTSLQQGVSFTWTNRWLILCLNATRINQTGQHKTKHFGVGRGSATRITQTGQKPSKSIVRLKWLIWVI